MLPAFPSLKDLMTDFRAEAERDYPALANRFCIFDVQSGLYFISGDFDFVAHGFETREAFETYLVDHETSQTCRDDNPRAIASKHPEHDLMIIFFNQDYTDAQRAALPIQEVMDTYHTLDHELAHLTIPAAYDTYNESPQDALLAENIAETYAVLRHHQRFATAATPLKISAIELASDMIMQQPALRSHFYYPTIRTIEDLDLKMIGTLDLKTTALFSEELARTHAPQQKNVNAIMKATERCRKAYASGGIRAALPVLAEVAFSGKSDDITRLSIDVCLHYLNAPGSMLLGAPWTKLRQDLKEFDARLNQSAMLAEARHVVAHRKPATLSFAH